MDCCLWALSGPEGGEGTISKMCVQFNILDSILIFVPTIWGSYQVWLLSLGTITKMCLQLNILDSILTVGLQHFSGAQLSGAQAQLFGAQLSGARLSGPDYPGPIIRGPICLEPAPMFCTNIRMEWKMLGCSHILEIVLSPCPMHS